MNEYRITKYDPKMRVDGLYLANDWTSISDIGKKFPSGVLTLEQYTMVENRYISCCIELLEKAGVSRLYIKQAEIYDAKIALPKYVADKSSIGQVIRDCLREKYWAKLENTDFFIHFGYDYYMYVGTDLTASITDTICKKHSLYCEKFRSPYHD